MSTLHHLLSQTLLPGLAHTGTGWCCNACCSSQPKLAVCQVLFAEMHWIGTAEANPSEAPLEMPAELQEAIEHAPAAGKSPLLPSDLYHPLDCLSGLPEQQESTELYRTGRSGASCITVTSRSIVCSAAAVREEGKRSDRCSACTQARQRRTAARQPSGSGRRREKARPSGPPSRRRSAAAAAPRCGQPRSRSGERRQRATRQTRRMTSMTVQSPLSSLCKSLWIARGPACY